MSERKRSPKEPTNGKCSNFINGNCSFNCPNAALEAACDEIIRLYETRWSSHDTCDFYDEYEELEKKYLK